MRRRMDLYARWSQEMEQQQFFHAGQRVGVAVSGGPDSVLLLHFMGVYAQEHGLALAAVHFNHRLRGAESDGDEALVRGLAKEMHVEFLRGEADVARVARERRGNLEAVARDLRYRFFYSLVDQEKLDRIATAHTANDQAETVLMRLLRGSGTRGLGGIFPTLDGKVVRPFLGVTREEVMAEVAARRLAYRVDSSNLDSRFRRNKIRAELLPLLIREYNPAIVALLNQLAERLRDDEACLESTARHQALPWRVREGNEERIPIRALRELPAALARRVLAQMVQAARGTAHGIEHVHLESLRRFAAQAQSGRSLTLPGGWRARKEFSWMVVGPAAPEAETAGFCYEVTLPGEVQVAELGSRFCFKILGHNGAGEGYNNTKSVHVDPQRLGGKLVLRNWRAGDRFWPSGSRGYRKLKELFREHKIPEKQRKDWPVLESAGEIAWVRGFPPGRAVAANGQTPQVLVIEESPLPLGSAIRESPL